MTCACVCPSCFAVDVVADRIVTVNIELTEGPTRFHVSRPNLDGLQEKSGQNVGY